MQKIARASQSRIVFGYITALQMLRMAQPCELASVRSGKPSIPERAPRTKELSLALERIEGDHPGLRFERPSHVLVSTPNGRAGGALRSSCVHEGLLAFLVLSIGR